MSENPGERRNEGGCLCGAVRFSCAATPDSVSYCHCRMCQKASGGPFSVMANVPRAALIWRGAPQRRRSSPHAVRGVSGACGTPRCVEYDDSEHVSLSVGAFDHPESLRPTEHGGVEGMLPWVHAEPGLPRERTDEDADYRRLCAQSGWKPPFEG